MSVDNNQDLPNVEEDDTRTDGVPHKPPKKTKAYVLLAIVIVVIVVISVLMRLSDKPTAEVEPEQEAEREATMTESKISSDKELLDSVMASLSDKDLKGGTDTRKENLNEDDDNSKALGEGVSSKAETVTFDSSFESVLEGAIDKLESRQNARFDGLRRELQLINETQRKVVEVLSKLSTNQKDLRKRQPELSHKLDEVLEKIGHVRISLNDIGGKVEKENSSFSLLIWGPETYAGQRKIRVSTMSHPKSFSSLAVGESLAGWKLKDIKSSEAVFVNEAGQERVEGL